MADESMAPETFGIVAVRPDPVSAAVSPAGDLDVSTSPRLLACIDELLAEGRSKIVVDLRAVTFIDSSGLGALVKAHKHAGPTARLTVVQPPPHVHRAMEISGILKVITVEPAP
ncbi:MAG TPA: STAS domain-containing protein [Acidimicrobiales bacterium]|nr:STAS domain-containing protein [Acidimicrobiales bacterium]